jgi:hypothetical protein
MRELDKREASEGEKRRLEELSMRRIGRRRKEGGSRQPWLRRQELRSM